VVSPFHLLHVQKKIGHAPAPSIHTLGKLCTG
jgi:hypothetical protein